MMTRDSRTGGVTGLLLLSPMFLKLLLVFSPCDFRCLKYVLYESRRTTDTMGRDSRFYLIVYLVLKRIVEDLEKLFSFNTFPASQDFCRLLYCLLMFSGNIYGKQYGTRSDCSGAV